MVIYGAGADLNLFLKKYSFDKHIEAIVDADTNKVGTNIHGIKVFGREYLNNLRQGERVYISSSRYYDEILAYININYPDIVALKISDLLCFNHNENKLSKVLYNRAASERRVYEEFKDDYVKYDEIFFERYNKLTSGLDSDSVDTINTILKRLALLFSSDKAELDIWNNIEIAELKKIQEKLYDKILEINENLFVYKEFRLPKKYFDNGIYYYYYGIPALKNINKAFSGDVIDCGAFIGDSSLLFSKYTSSQVYAIEAQKENIDLINQTIDINSVKNIVPINIGVSDAPGTAFIYENDNSNLGTFYPYSGREYGESISVEIDTIDSIVEQYKMRPSFIKADIEGSETAMLKGAIDTLKKYRPTMIICLHHTSTDFWGIKPFVESLDLGYKFKIFKKTDGNILTGTWLIAEAD